MRLRTFLFALGLSVSTSLAAGCASDGSGSDASESDLTSSSSVNDITSEAQFNALSLEGGGFGQAGRITKFLIDARDKNATKPFFLNSNFKVGGKTPDFVKFHFFFAQHQLGITEDGGQFNAETYFTDDKKFYAGTIQTYEIDGKPLFAISLYPDDVIHDEGILELVKILKPHLAIPGARMAFVAGGKQQSFERVKSQLGALGYEAFSIEQVLGNVKYLPLNPGEAWGNLRIFPKDSGELRPTDIVVFDELPLDLTVVAGTMTRVFQDVTSHVNLKSKERGTPNMVFRDASPTNAKLAPFADKPVHLVVGKTGFTIEPTTDAIVQQKLKERTDKPWQPLTVVAEENLIRYDDMCKTLTTACTQNGDRLGGKAANLGLLANRDVLGRMSQPGTKSAQVGYDLTPQGFAIPVQWYRDFVNAPENAALKAKLDELIAKEKNGELSPNDRKTRSLEVQNLFYTGRVPAAQLATVNAEITHLQQIEPLMKDMKFRSSANAEDIPNFDGAGLHDSYEVKSSSVDHDDMACHVEETPDGLATKREIKPKTPQCGIKGVFASLWNTRAIEERSFARLDHATASMGIAVVPEYDTESEVAANGVIITRSVNSDFLAYTLGIQRGNNLVTNPEPGTIAQMTFATFGDGDQPTRFTFLRFATPEANKPALTAPVLPEPQMVQVTELTRHIEQQYCSVKPGYYDGDCRFVHVDDAKPKALDLEFKFLENGHFVIKQSREFHGH